MAINLAFALSLLLTIGFLSQWLAWRMRIPAILLLLLVGMVIGPFTGIFDPDTAFGELLFPGISLAVAIILFEGSLTLHFNDLRGVGKAIRGLVSYGAVVTLLLLALAAHWFAGLSWELAFLFGALTCVTGPTVIMPMLRTLRPTPRIARVLRWEGIIIDPIGALFAVLVYEAIVSHHEGHSLGIFALTILIGTVIGLVAAYALGVALRRQLIPEFLQTYATLAAVLAAFSASNTLANESGLLAVTVMGIFLANMRDIYLEHITDFKEHLSVILVSMLFVVLAARLEWPLPGHVLWAGFFIFLAAQFIIRPVAVLISTWGSPLTWRERALVSYVSPRGIVAAAVSSLFALRVADLGLAGSSQFVPLVFMVIIGTVMLQSLTARPLARWLRVTEPDPTGVLFFGSDTVARTLATSLQDKGFNVLIADDDWDGTRAARMAGLPTFYGNPTSQHAAVHLDLSGIGHLLAVSSRREMNSLTCMQYRQILGREAVYKLRVLAPDARQRDHFAGSIEPKALFENDITHAELAQRLQEGWYVKTTLLTNEYDWDAYRQHNGADILLLFAVDAGGILRIASNKQQFEPKPGWSLLVLVPADAPAAPPKKIMQKAVAKEAKAAARLSKAT